MKQIIEVEIDIPEGYKFKGFGVPTPADYCYLGNGRMEPFDGLADWVNPELLFEKETTFREPTDADIGKKVMVRDYDYNQWIERTFVGKDFDGEFATFDPENRFELFRFAQISCEPVAEPPKVAQSEYRDVTEDDIGKFVWVRNSQADDWELRTFQGFTNNHIRELYRADNLVWKYARIGVEPVAEPPKVAQSEYRDATAYDIGEMVEVRDNELEPWSTSILRDVRSNREFPFKGDFVWWRYARIKV